MESTPDSPSSRRRFERYAQIDRRLQLLLIRRIVNGFYSPLRDQIERAVSEGFITPANTSLIKFVDLESGDDEARDWGRRAMEALESWVWDVSIGLLMVITVSLTSPQGIRWIQSAVEGQWKIGVGMLGM